MSYGWRRQFRADIDRRESRRPDRSTGGGWSGHPGEKGEDKGESDLSRGPECQHFMFDLAWKYVSAVDSVDRRIRKHTHDRSER